MLNLRSQFPIFTTNPELVYLDSAATSQKPAAVIEAVSDFYRTANANIHRGLYPLSTQATEKYEAARKQVARFIHATNPTEIIFTRSATEALNLLSTVLPTTWPAGGNIILSEAEHHANFLPWQQLARAKKIEVRFAKITKEGEIGLESFRQLIDANTGVVSITHCSNVLGNITPIPHLKKILTEQGSQALLIVDAAQSVPHFPINVQELGCDFLAFSGHKMYGPSGIGVLWGRRELLEKLPPYQTGGEMIRSVTFEETTWNDLPWKFEAGTPNIEGAIGLGAAVQWLESMGMENIASHTATLSEYAREQLKNIPNLQIIGNPAPQSGILSFVIEGIHPHDLASLLGERNICIRAGHHCAAPLHQILKLAATNRISFGAYNTLQDIDTAVVAIKEITQEIKNA